MQFKPLHRRLLAPTLCVLAALLWFWPPRPITPQELTSRTIETGSLQFKTTRGRVYLLFNGATLSCSGGTFHGSNKCPGYMPDDKLPIAHCTVEFVHTKTLIQTDIKVVTSVACEGKSLPDLSSQSLNAYRNRIRQAHTQLLLPISIGVILFFAFIRFHTTGKFSS